MKSVCAWCHEPLDNGPADGGLISHGICPRCLEFALARRTGIHDFLNTIDAPVLAVDGDVRAVGANDAALRLLGKGIAQVQDRLSGEIVECENAALPGGCGRTDHCTGCQIRSSVIHTRATGEPLLRVPAFQHVVTPTGVKTVRFLISTEEVPGGVVLLRIDEAQEAKDRGG
jgi:hypothetical protein